MRVTASGALASASLAVFVGSVVGAWATSDFWETIPVVPCVLGVAVLAACAFYARRKGLLASVAVGFLAALITFLVTLAVGSSRWGS